MQAKHRLHLVFFQHSGIADDFRAAGGFLCRLKNQQNVPVQVRFAAETTGQFQQNCHMAVMAAGVHLSIMSRSIVRFTALKDGQSITIRPESNGLLRAKVKPGAQSPFHRGKYMATQSGQHQFQILHGFGQFPLQFRNPVQGPAVFDDLHSLILQEKAVLIILHPQTTVNFRLANPQKRWYHKVSYSHIQRSTRHERTGNH